MIVSSATLDAVSFSEYFSYSSEQPVVVSLEGRMFPVQIAYLQEPTPDYVSAAAATAWRINLQVRLLLLSIYDPIYYAA